MMVKGKRGRPKKVREEEVEEEEIEEEDDEQEDEFDLTLEDVDDSELGDLGLGDDDEETEEEEDEVPTVAKTGHAKVIEDLEEAAEEEAREKAKKLVAKRKAEVEKRNAEKAAVAKSANGSARARIPVKAAAVKLKPEVIEGLKDQLHHINGVLEDTDDPKLRRAEKHITQALVWFEALIKG